jgi:hypothetical protein
VGELDRCSKRGGHVGAIQRLETEALKVGFSREREEVDVAHAQFFGHVQGGLDKHCSYAPTSHVRRHRNRAKQRTVAMDFQPSGAHDSVAQSCDENCGQVVQKSICRQLALFHQAKHVVCIPSKRSFNVGFHWQYPLFALSA